MREKLNELEEKQKKAKKRLASFTKRRQTFDQKFLNEEEDRPISVRRLNIIHNHGGYQRAYRTGGDFSTKLQPRTPQHVDMSRT